MLNSVYLEIVNLLNNNIFAGLANQSPYQDFWIHGVAILACTFLVALPFLIVYRIVKRFI